MRRCLELAHDCQVFVTDLLEQPSHRFEVSGTARCLRLCQALSENSGADRSGARFECVCRALNRFRTSFFHGLLQSCKAPGSILNEGVEQSCDYVLDASLAKVCAEARQVYMRRSGRSFRAL
jgi:hypothetical protein